MTASRTMYASQEKVKMSTSETIDAQQLAERWRVPKTWVRNWTRQGYANDPIPHVKLGKYVRFEWGSTALMEWWNRRRQ